MLGVRVNPVPLIPSIITTALDQDALGISGRVVHRSNGTAGACVPPDYAVYLRRNLCEDAGALIDAVVVQTTDRCAEACAATVRARPRHLSALGVSHSDIVFRGRFCMRAQGA